jgi:hypothetical protein
MATHALGNNSNNNNMCQGQKNKSFFVLEKCSDCSSNAVPDIAVPATTVPRALLMLCCLLLFASVCYCLSVAGRAVATVPLRNCFFSSGLFPVVSVVGSSSPVVCMCPRLAAPAHYSSGCVIFLFWGC